MIEEQVVGYPRWRAIILGRPTIEVENIVAFGYLHGEIDLERTAMKLKHSIFEPDQFPGLSTA